MEVRAKINVRGTKPLLFHTFPMTALSSKTSKAGEDEWKDTVLMDKDRKLYVYPTYFVKSIADGGKEIKQGRGSIAPKVASTLGIVEDQIYLAGLAVPEDKDLLRDSGEPVYLDVRSVVNPMTKGRNLRYRIAAKTGWQCEFTVFWDDSLVSKENMKQCIQNAGSFQGVGDGRKVGFGRYTLEKFTVL